MPTITKRRFDFKRWRKEARMTQREAAEAMEVTVSTIRRWETGTTYPNAALLFEMAETYGCRVDDLLGLERRGK